MSLSGALNSAITGLYAQSTALASVSGNLANADTTGYKATGTSFASLVTGSGSTTRSTGNGVTTSLVNYVSNQGTIEGSETATNLAISGSGFFVVTDGPGSDATYYTRAGDFSSDADGYLVNSSGYYLLGYPLDSGDSVSVPTSVGALEPIDIDSINGTAEATTSLDLQVNLPADAATGDSVDMSTEVHDSLGVSHSVTVTYTKTADNSWTMSFDDPTLTNDSSVTSGTAGGSIDLVFNSDGTLASTNPDPAELTLTGLTTGASDSTISLGLGTAGDSDGLTQYASGNDDPDLTIYNIDTDGAAYAGLSSIEIDEQGVVTAVFSNGASRAIAVIPLATFQNPNGLTALSDTVFAASPESGGYVLNVAGEGGAGSVEDSSLEASTVDTTDEFARMIKAQQAYSASSQVVSTVKDMYDTLLSAMR
ncbi:flagellar hook protein FlgE [Tistlia consotensis]|uniref:Flagellar hook protein FlgE n=1 Tax=Tistlia consotensis USBA 355 TaxID=560819 RepID=A0A1Y6B7C9_9PROT|nr:flagellar hook protein FlgE [Tistlia consotensis]SME96897.1 flagellar hook protein FlgE [Tistlia consotensis USBA 355]SNR56291.1 flagellar hook protein FlgE [Tistlia consotensis]